LIVVLSPILSQEEAAGEWDRIKSLVHRNGGGDPYEERWGMRRLAYPIKKAGQTFLEGNYLLARFSSDTVAPPELDAHLRLSESVLRYLLTKAGPPESTPPSPQMVQMTRAAEIRQQQAAAAQAAATAQAQEAEQPSTSAGEAEAQASSPGTPAETAPPEAAAPEGAEAVAEETAPEAEAPSDDAPVDDVSVEEPAEEDSATAEESAPAEDTDAEESRQDDR
jgi:small subunit ribosomal protein S6